jgi:hypothetical protein
MWAHELSEFSTLYDANITTPQKINLKKHLKKNQAI